ncbi:Ion transport protein-domain-containing protein, partial [Baffinella frigidus]
DPRKYNARSVYLFTLNNPTRKLLIRGLENPWWDRIVLSLIFLNTVQLLITDPLDVPAMRPVSQQREIMEGIGLFFTWVFTQREIIEIVGLFFTWVFTVECFLKVIALGFIMGHGSYLSNSWNWLDFFIVCVGMIEILIPNAGNLTSLRALRVMRPLRAITRFPELQALVVLLLNCIPQL